MPSAKRFEDLEVWQRARDLTRLVYRETSKTRFGNDFALRDQMRRAAVSVMSNLAEGFEREGSREFSQFVALAKGSCGEIRSQAYVAVDQNYFSEETFQEISESAKRLSRMLSSLLRYLKRSPIEGSKYKLAR